MKKYTFINTLNTNIKIIIIANSFTNAMELLLLVTRDIEDYRIKE